MLHFRGDGLREGRQANAARYTGICAWLEDPEITALCFDYIYYADHNGDLKAAYGYDKEKLYSHWITSGIAEGRSASPVWNGKYYMQINQDVARAFQNDCTMAYRHFVSFGYKELRTSSEYYDGRYYQNRYLGEFGRFNGKQLLLHYKNYGLREGRQANTVRYDGSTCWK